MVVKNSQYTTPLNNQSYNQQGNRFSMFSVSSSRLSISSSPSIASSFRYQPSAPPLDNQPLSLDSSRFSISSSPRITPSIQKPPTAPLETSLNRIRINDPYMYNNRYFENNQIKSKRYHHFRDDI